MSNQSRVIALGFFDGVHLGHAALLRRAAELAEARGLPVRVGNLLRFRRVDILYYSENGKYAICSAEEREGYLSLYDDMAVEGKDLYDGKLVD